MDAQGKIKSKKKDGEPSAADASQTANPTGGPLSFSSNSSQKAGPSGAALSLSLNPASSNSRTSGIMDDSSKKKKERKPKLDTIKQENEEDNDEDEFDAASQGDREQDDEEEREGLVKALRRMGIRAPKPFDPRRDRKFETWLNRTEYHLMVTKCPDEDRTACLLLLLD